MNAAFHPLREEVFPVHYLGMLLFLASTLATFGNSSLASAAYIGRLPPALEETLLEASRQIDFAQECLERYPEHAARLEKLDELLNSKADEVGGNWGERVQLFDPTLSEMRPRRCSKKNIGQALNRAEQSLANFDRLVTTFGAPFHNGLWVGPMKLCAQTVVRSAMLPMTDIGQAALLVELTPSATDEWKKLTRRTVNIRLNIGLDGTTIAQPIVHEESQDGSLWISGPEIAVLREAQVALAKAC